MQTPSNAVTLAVLCLSGFGTGCHLFTSTDVRSPSPGIVLSPVLIERDNGTVTCSDNDIAGIAKRADSTPAEVASVALSVGDYTQEQLVSKLPDLSTDDEDLFLSMVDQRGWLHSGDSGSARTSGSGGQDPVERLKAFLHKLQKEKILDAILGRPLSKDDSDSLWQTRSQVLRRVAIKDTARQWILSQLASHRFAGAINVTIDIATTDRTPVLASDLIFISANKSHPMAFLRKNRDCNADQTLCRYIYFYPGLDAGPEWSSLFAHRRTAPWGMLGLMNSSTTSEATQDEEAVRTLSAPGGDASDSIRIEALLAGAAITRDLPSRYIRVVDKLKPGDAMRQRR
jgi:hypothetical protein